jgi:DNA-binding MarR family transcriptional regulator
VSGDGHAPSAAETASALIVLLANKLTSGASSAYRDSFGVGTIESRILTHLAGERWITPQRICKLGGLDKGGVSRSMKFLHERGLIVVRESAADARSVELALTAKGQSVQGRLARIASERERRLLSGLSRPEVRALLDTLRRLNERIPSVNSDV